MKSAEECSYLIEKKDVIGRSEKRAEPCRQTIDSKGLVILTNIIFSLIPLKTMELMRKLRFLIFFNKMRFSPGKTGVEKAKQAGDDSGRRQRGTTGILGKERAQLGNETAETAHRLRRSGEPENSGVA